MEPGNETRSVKMLRGDPEKAVVKLSIPIMISNLVFTLYNFADGIWVSGLGANALSAVGIFFPIFMVFIALCMGISVGTSSAIARGIGANRDVSNIAIHSVLISVVIAVVITSSYFYLDHLLKLMGAGGEVLKLSLEYSRIIVLGSIFLVFNNVSGGIMNGEGNTRVTMYANVSGSISNIVLDPIFIYPLHLGISGAAYATVVSMSISSSIFTYWFLKRKSFVRLRFGEFKGDRRIAFDILRVGIPSSFSILTMSAAIAILNTMIVRSGGSDGIAVFTGAWRVVSFGFIPIFGMSGAVTTVVGASYGAKNVEKIRKAYLHALRVAIAAEVAIALAMIALSPYLARLFTYSRNSVGIYPMLVDVMKTLPVLLPFSPLGIMTVAMFQGLGRGENAFAITLLRSIIFQLSLAYLFAFKLALGFFGIVAGIVIGNVAASLIAFSWGVLTLKRLEQFLS